MKEKYIILFSFFFLSACNDLDEFSSLLKSSVDKTVLLVYRLNKVEDKYEPDDIVLSKPDQSTFQNEIKGRFDKLVRLFTTLVPSNLRNHISRIFIFKSHHSERDLGELSYGKSSGSSYLGVSSELGDHPRELYHREGFSCEAVLYVFLHELGHHLLINRSISRELFPGIQEASKELFRELPYNEEDFVTKYASTNPQEDLAETFCYFVLGEKPDEHTSLPKEKKILFFYRNENRNMVLIRKILISGLIRARALLRGFS